MTRRALALAVSLAVGYAAGTWAARLRYRHTDEEYALLRDGTMP